MRVIFALGLAAGLVACTAETGAEAPEAPPVETAAAPVASEGSCADIARVAAAMSETPPLLSLSTGNVMLGDHKVEDSFTTAVAPADAACQIGKMGGWDPGDPDTYVMNCTLFTAGVFDEEENGVKAQAAFDAAAKELAACLPATLIARDGPNNGFETNQSLIFETAEDKARSEAGDRYVYPIQLSKEFDQYGNLRGGKPPGWRVTLNFQKEGPAAPAQ